MTGFVVRFVQATNLRLDYPLRGIGKPNRDCLDTIRDASFRAYENLVGCCIEQDVDFLLLCGNCFQVEDRSLPAQAALLHGLEKLNDHGIEVVVAPGKEDPFEAWLQLPSLPQNVNVLDANKQTTMLEFGQNLPTVKISLDLGKADIDEPQESGIFRLIVSSNDEPFSPQVAERSLKSNAFDYLAIGGSGQRQTFSNGLRMIHHSGPVIPIEKNDRGPHGISLIEIDENRNLQFRFDNVSPVRREIVKIEIEENRSWEDVWKQVRKTAQQLVERKANALCEKVCLIDWLFVDSLLLTRGMPALELSRKIDSFLRENYTENEMTDFVHSVEVRYPEIRKMPSENENGELDEYLKVLDHVEYSMQGNLKEYIRGHVAGEKSWEPHLQQFLDGIELEQVFSEARRKGVEVFSKN